MFSFSKIKKIIYSVSVLSGTIIGVGIFSLPYIASKVGISVFLGYFLVLGMLVILVHLFFGKVALRTPDFKRLPGFAEFYLGKWGKFFALISIIFGLFGSILAYLIIGGRFLTEIFSPFFGGSEFLYTLFYFIFGAFLIYYGIRIVSKIEFLGLLLFLGILILIFFQNRELIQFNNLLFKKPSTRFADLFLPYGPVLFSLWGAALIPELEEGLGNFRQLLKKIIPVAVLVSIFVYLFFVFLILGITGSQTTESALTGLKNFLDRKTFSFLLFFGAVSTFTSFIALGLTLKKVFWYDLKIPHSISWTITCFLPFFLYLIGIKSFIPVISFVGAVMLGIEGILILLMYGKIESNKKKKIGALSLSLLFLGGIFYEIIHFLF